MAKNKYKLVAEKKSISVVKRKHKEENIISVLARERKVLQTTVHIGDCSRCFLRESCSYANDTDSTCRAMAVATEQFILNAMRSEFINPERGDDMGLRALASLHGVIVLFEMYFNQYGYIHEGIGKGEEIFHFLPDLAKEYPRLLSLYQLQLAMYGLNPKGRELIRASLKGSSSNSLDNTAFARYIEAKAVMKKPGKPVDVNFEENESTGEDKHNRVCERSGIDELPVAAYPSSGAQVDLPDTNGSGGETDFSDDHWFLDA